MVFTGRCSSVRPSSCPARLLDRRAHAARGAHRTANACFKDVADIAAQLEQYPVAIEKYELVAQASLKSPLTRYSVKDYYLKAGLCHLCTGVR